MMTTNHKPKPMTHAAKLLIPWSIPQVIDLNAPFIYFIEVESAAGNTYRYVGKARSRSRLREYEKNINRALARETSRPRFKKNGEPQSPGNCKYRYVHLALVKAVEEGWQIKGEIIKNCPKEDLTVQEKYYIRKYACNLNHREMWCIDKYEEMSAAIQ